MKKSVLVVDDNPTNIDIIKEVLKEEYSIKEATDGMTALQIADRIIPDIILLDIVMPEMDGYEVCRRLKSNPVTKDIPVIFISALEDATDEARGFIVGAVDFLHKPFNPVVMKHRINTQLVFATKNEELSRLVEAKTAELRYNQDCLTQALMRATEMRNYDTHKHGMNVSLYAKVLAEWSGLSKFECDLIFTAAKLHDIGKLGISDELLMKQGVFSNEEYELIKQHSVLGSDLLKDFKGTLLETAKIIIEQHHERHNGNGYPKGLAGDEIHDYAKIVAISDVFDALSSKRNYKRTWTFDEAFEYIANNEKLDFNPKTVKNFIKAKEDFYKLYVELHKE